MLHIAYQRCKNQFYPIFERDRYHHRRAATTKMTYLLKSTSLLDAAILETSVPIKIKTPWSQMLPAIQVRFMNDG